MSRVDQTFLRVKVVSVGRENEKPGNTDCVHDNLVFIELTTNQLMNNVNISLNRNATDI